MAVSARNDAALDVHDVDVGDRKVSVAAWPGDAEWSAFVEKNLTDGLPALEKRLSIVEASTPYLYGYAGWFLPLQNKIEVGEDLDDRTLLHELSHAWFNRDLFDARWINEGLAEELSARALAELGGKLDDPEVVHLDSSNAVALESWSAPRSRTSDDDSEHWGYNASFHVMRRLTTEIGMDGLDRVIDGAARDVAAYRAPGDDARTFDGPDDWKRLLDLLDEAGGAKEADEIFRTYVVPKEQAAERASARTAYAALRTAGGEWAVPEGVIGAMNAWRFVKATPVMEAATAVLRARDELATTATAAGVNPAATDEAAYERAETVEELGAMRTHLEREQAGIGTLAAARARVAAPRSCAQRTGLRGRHPEAELAAADAAYALPGRPAGWWRDRPAAAAPAVRLVGAAEDRRPTAPAGRAAGPLA